jgi:hypothetical protein
MNDSEIFERINKINSMIVLILQTKVAQKELLYSSSSTNKE